VSRAISNSDIGRYNYDKISPRNVMLDRQMERDPNLRHAFAPAP